MKTRICTACMLGVIVIGTLCGCGTSANAMEEYGIRYTINDDGSYIYRGDTYKYMIEVSGIEGESQVTLIILTNDTDTSFEDVTYGLKKAEMSTGTPQFAVLGWY